MPLGRAVKGEFKRDRPVDRNILVQLRNILRLDSQTQSLDKAK